MPIEKLMSELLQFKKMCNNADLKDKSYGLLESYYKKIVFSYG